MGFKLFRKSLIGICALFILIIVPSINASAQDYDYDSGIDSWLSNSTNWYPALDGGYHLFGNGPVPTQISNPGRGLRELSNQAIVSADNFYTINQEWIWNEPNMFVNDYPHRLLYYVNDNHGNLYDNGSGKLNKYDALFINFYARPKPSYVDSSLSGYQYTDGSNCWAKPGTDLEFRNEGYNSDDGGWLRHPYAKVEGDGIHLEAEGNSNGQYYQTGNATFDWAETLSDTNGYVKAKYKFKINDDSKTVTVGSSFKNGNGVGYHPENYTGASGYMEWYNKFTVKTDGTAPGFTDSSNSVVDNRVSTIINLDENLNANIRIDNLFDNGSGTKSVYAKMYPTGREGEAKEFQLINSNGEWNLANTDMY